MIDKNLISYISQKISQGYSLSEIKQSLVSAGHSSETIDDTIKEIFSSKNELDKKVQLIPTLPYPLLKKILFALALLAIIGLLIQKNVIENERNAFFEIQYYERGEMIRELETRHSEQNTTLYFLNNSLYVGTGREQMLLFGIKNPFPIDTTLRIQIHYITALGDLMQMTYTPDINQHTGRFQWDEGSQSFSAKKYRPFDVAYSAPDITGINQFLIRILDLEETILGEETITITIYESETNFQELFLEYYQYIIIFFVILVVILVVDLGSGLYRKKK